MKCREELYARELQIGKFLDKKSNVGKLAQKEIDTCIVLSQVKR